MLGFGLSIEPQLWALIFVMIRVGATFIAAPVFGAVAVPLPALLWPLPVIWSPPAPAPAQWGLPCLRKKR